jgi:hypothetical protein
MKMFLKSMMALLALVFVMGSYDANAQCPPGTGSCTWTTVTMTRLITVDPTTIPERKCVFEISFCYRVCVTNCEAYLSKVKFDLDCMDGIDFSDTYIQDQIALEIVKNTPCALTTAPCTDPQPVATYQIASCLSGTVKEKSPLRVGKGDDPTQTGSATKGSKNSDKVLGNSPSDYYVEIVPCEATEVKCETVYKSCIDYSVSPPVRKYIKHTTQTLPVEECSTSVDWVIHDDWYLIYNYNTGCMPLCE